MATSKNIADTFGELKGDWTTWSKENETTNISWTDLKKSLSEDKARSLGYDLLPHSQLGKGANITTDAGTTVTTTYNNDSTKIAEKKYRLPTGDVVSILGKESTVNSGGITKTVTTTVKSKGKKNIDGVTTSVSTSVKTSSTAILSSEDNYKKTETGVVTNTSKSAYDTARAAKKKRIEKENSDVAVKNAVDILKNEVPVDIFEIKQILKMIMDHLGITLVDNGSQIIAPETTTDGKKDYSGQLHEINGKLLYLG